MRFLMSIGVAYLIASIAIGAPLQDVPQVKPDPLSALVDSIEKQLGMETDMITKQFIDLNRTVEADFERGQLDGIRRLTDAFNLHSTRIEEQFKKISDSVESSFKHLGGDDGKGETGSNIFNRVWKMFDINP